MTALQRYLAREDARDELTVANRCLTSDCCGCSLEENLECLDDGGLFLKAFTALCEELERVEWMLREAEIGELELADLLRRWEERSP